MKLFYFERWLGDDEVIIIWNVIEVLFRCFVGCILNLIKLNEDEILVYYYFWFYIKILFFLVGEMFDWFEGIIVWKFGGGEKIILLDDYIFLVWVVVNWMLDFMLVMGIDEVVEIFVYFVWYGLIIFVSDKGKIKEENLIVSVWGGGVGGGVGVIMVSNFWIYILVEI